MAGNEQRSNKSFLGHMLKYFKGRQKMHECSSETESGSSKNVTNLQENPKDVVTHYITWPSSQLHISIVDHAKKMFSDCSTQDINVVLEEVEVELNALCPFQVPDQWDFCLMCPQIDHYKAVNLQRHICACYDIIGEVVWEKISLGSDILCAIENMVLRSTKLLFYVTENFDDSDVCAHIARNHLVARNSEDCPQKVIPLIESFDTRVPQPFQLVDKLYLSSQAQFKYRFPAIFTPELKQEKALRALKAENEVDCQRKSFMESLVRKKLAPHTLTKA